jgi:MFS family permease
MNKQAQTKSALFQDTNLRWMISGASLSLLGDQFTLIALPWLVLKMTGDTLILGIVLALIGVPRALFMLIGGAVVDKYSPKSVMMLTKYLNTALLGILALALFTASLQLWMVYLLSLLLGISTAFSIPSGTAMMPRVVASQHLQAANGVMLSVRQLTFFLGPLMAGALIALLGDASSVSHPSASSSAIADAHGLAAAFFIDCLSYAISALTLAQVRMLPLTDKTNKAQSAILQAVLAGLRHCWADKMLRTCFIYWSAVAFFIMGPIQIAMPVLAQHLGNSASTLGLLAGAHGAGTLLGMLLSSVRPNWRLASLGGTILAIDFAVGLLFIPLGIVSASWQGAAILLTIGILSGFIHVAVYTFIQRQVPPAMIGRAMSIFMFIFMGIGPVSAALTGWLMHSVSIAQLFVFSGGMLLLIVLLALVLSPMRRVNGLC